MIFQHMSVQILAVAILVVAYVGNADSAEWNGELPPLIAVDAAAEARINSVLLEMDRNYGGTLVVDPADSALDSPAFVQRYLRRFAGTTEDRHTYSYRCERLLARLANFPAPLAAAALDADMWQAYRLYEQKIAGETTYQQGNIIHTAYSTRDVLWMYLANQAQTIWSNDARRTWWLDRLLVDKATNEERQARAFAVLQLITAVMGRFERAQFVQVDQTKKPAGNEGLGWFAEQMQVGCVAIGFDPATLPAPRIDEVNISGRMTSFEIAPIIDQESWSKKRQFFYARFLVPIGQRGGYTSVRLPMAMSGDGLFFFFSPRNLYVWPKEKFSVALPQLLETVGLITGEERQALAASMKVTAMTVQVIKEAKAMEEAPKK